MFRGKGLVKNDRYGDIVEEALGGGTETRVMQEEDAYLLDLHRALFILPPFEAVRMLLANLGSNFLCLLFGCGV